VEILGGGLTGTSKVQFGSGSATSFNVVSDTYMTVVVPASGTKGTVVVTTPSGPLKSKQVFTVLPVISSFTPTSGGVGTLVKITGSGLTGATKVTFGGVAATFTVNSGTQITATVPSGAVTGKIKITTAGGSATSTGTFTVT
jgi:IPT/TIG domain-containing protein